MLEAQEEAKMLVEVRFSIYPEWSEKHDFHWKPPEKKTIRKEMKKFFGCEMKKHPS